MTFRVEVDYRATKVISVEAGNRDDAAWEATYQAEKEGLTVTGTYVEAK